MQRRIILSILICGFFTADATGGMGPAPSGIAESALGGSAAATAAAGAMGFHQLGGAFNPAGMGALSGMSLADHPLANDMQQRAFLSNLTSSAGSDGCLGRGPAAMMGLGDPSSSLAFLYGRMPSAMIELARQQANSGSSSAGAPRPPGSDPRSPSPVMSEEDAFRLCMAKVDAGKSCQPACDIHPAEHYHCRSDGCSLSFK